MNNTSIEWTDSTWNPLRGCSRVSEGCRNCYAETVANRFCKPGSPYDGVVQIGADGKGTGKWNGQIKFVESRLLDPLKWKKPQRIFVNSMSDLFHEGVTDQMLDRIFAVMALCPQHTFQILTKRPERMLRYLSQDRVLMVDRIAVTIGLHFPLGTEQKLQPIIWPLPNVHLGVSVEDQKAADLRITLLLQTPAAVRFLSCEPLLGSINFRWAKWDDWSPHPRRVKQLPPVPRNGQWIAGSTDELDGLRMLDWVIVGGESGPGARPMHPDWARTIRDQCVKAGVPFLFKQWGKWQNGSDLPVHRERDIVVFNDGRSCPPTQHECYEEQRRSGIDHGAARPTMMSCVGKKAAGRLLDDVEWNQFPR